MSDYYGKGIGDKKGIVKLSGGKWCLREKYG